MRKVILCSSFAAAGLLAVPAAYAATATGSLDVKVSINETCSVTSPSSTTLDFGSQTLLNVAVDAQTNISVQCSTGTDYDVSLDGGLNTSRQMRLGSTSNYVDYELYTDAARTTAWPTTAGSAPYSNTGTGSAQNITVYGQIPVQTTPVGGSYVDTVAITVTY